MSEESSRGFGRGGRGGGDDRGRGRGRGGRGRGGRGRGRGRDDKDAWTPMTKLGRLVLANKIQSLEEIFLYSIPIKEYQIVDHFLGSGGRNGGGDDDDGKLKDEVMTIHPVMKMTSAGQRTRFRACVAVGDEDGHLGVGTKCAKEVAGAIRGAIINAKLNIAPIRRGYWGSKLGKPHTVPCKVTGKCGSVRVRLIPAPRGAGLVAGPANKTLLKLAGISDCYTGSIGHTRTLGNFVQASFMALKATYGFLEPTLWGKTEFGVTPYQDHTDFLAREADSAKKKSERPKY
jgi:small subunit ribosomal protein S2e